MKGFGLALFVDQKSPKDGFFCGGDEVTPCSGVHELPTDKVWATNIRPYDFINGGFGQLRHLRSSNFFRTDIDFLIKEFGLEGDLAHACEYLYLIFRRAAAVVSDRHGISVEDAGIGLRQEVTAEFVSASLSAPLLNDFAMQECVTQSIQYNQGRTQSADRPRGSKIHSFVMPRSALAGYLCSLPLPSSTDWRPVNFSRGVIRVGSANGRSADDDEGKASFDRLMATIGERQYMLDIDIREMDKRYSAYKSFSVGDRTSRHWACVEEVAEISSYAIVDIRGGFACARNKEPQLSPDMPPEFSVSRSLANEIYSLGIASNRGKDSPSPWAAYIRCVERIVLGRAADVFAKAGFCVGSYGAGRVNLFLRSNEHKVACERALSVGLLPPFSMLEMQDPAQKVAFNPKLLYRDDLLDGAIKVDVLAERLESDFLRRFVTASAIKGESPSEIQGKLDELLDLPEARRLDQFGALAEQHLTNMPNVDKDEDNGTNSSDDLVF